jgi:hypothetical protein
MNVPAPMVPSSSRIGQLVRMTGMSRLSCGQATGRISREAIVQRSHASAKGGTLS